MAAKKVVVSFFALLVVTLLCACPPVSAAPEWVTMDDGAKYTCQVDLGTVRFFGEETDKTLDVWIKAIKKEPSDSYSITHMFIKEYLMYMEKERGKYSSTDDATISSTDSSEKGWGPLPADSPGGRIAKKLFAGYRAKEKAVAPPPIIVDPQE
ncbi:MAG TPA: hypothetical protein VN521_08230, partial [Negativicutes bacterium]|nr:hypothetical protein [Negativicutes bacterium]